MGKFLTSTGLTAALAFVATAAFAVPEKPINAAQVETPKDREGVGCYVSATGGGNIADYEYDPDCKSQVVLKRDKDGNLQSYRYQDKGNLQEGQTPPDKTIRNEWSSGICDYSEVIAPSGAYSSNATCAP